jgi:hypothetical protein
MKHGQMEHQGSSYRNLLFMAILSFLIMFALMYAMVDRFANIYANLNQAYMAALMAAPMVLIELLFMSAMYRKPAWNILIAALGLLVLVSCYVLIRTQGGIGDKQFLQSMIPHHAGAILMCEQAALTDPEVIDLCRRIRASQESEIAEMKAKLQALDR